MLETFTPIARSVKLRTGVTLDYAEQGNPAGLPVVLLHGYTDSWRSFTRVLPHLSLSLRVFAPSQRGHGDSDRPIGGYAPKDFSTDLAAFLAAFGLPRAVIVGHSMGAYVAQRLRSIIPTGCSGSCSSAPSCRSRATKGSAISGSRPSRI